MVLQSPSRSRNNNTAHRRKASRHGVRQRDVERVMMNWKTANYKYVPIGSHTGMISCATLSSSESDQLSTDKNAVGCLFATAGVEDHLVKIWECGEKARCAYILRGHTDAITCVKFDNSKAVTGSLDGTVRVWDLTESTVLEPDEMGDEDEGDGDGEDSGEDSDAEGSEPPRAPVCRHVLTHGFPFSQEVTCLEYIRDVLVTGCVDKRLRVFDLQSGRELRTLEGHIGAVSSLAMTDDIIASCGEEEGFILWKVEKSKDEERLGKNGVSLRMRISSGRHLPPFGHYKKGEGDNRRQAFVRILVDGKMVEATNPASVLSLDPVFEQDFYLEGLTLISKVRVELWDNVTDECIGDYEVPMVQMDDTVMHEGWYKLDQRDLPTGAELRMRFQKFTGAKARYATGKVTKARTSVPSIIGYHDDKEKNTSLFDIDTDGDILVTSLSGEGPNNMLIWSVENVLKSDIAAQLETFNRGLQETEGVAGVSKYPTGMCSMTGNVLVFKMEGNWLVSGSTYGEVVIWNRYDGSEVMKLSEHKKAITSLDFVYPRLATASEDGCVKLWNMETGQCVHTRLPDSAPVKLVMDDTTVYICEESGHVSLLDLTAPPKKEPLKYLSANAEN